MDQVVSHFWQKICFSKFKVLTFKTVNSFSQNLPLISVLDHKRSLSNAVVFLQNSESSNALLTTFLYCNRTSKELQSNFTEK